MAAFRQTTVFRSFLMAVLLVESASSLDIVYPGSLIPAYSIVLARRV